MSGRTQATVLIIDDDPVFVTWVSTVLTNSGYSVLSLPELASDAGSDELRLADIIILDLALPGQNGFEILDRFRLDPAIRDVPVLMLTAHDPIAYRLKGLSLGADDYMVKPPNKEELLLRLQALLRRSGTGTGDRMRMIVQAADRSRVLLDMRDVVYVEAANNFCYVYVAEKRFMTSDGLGAIADRLEPVFMRVHRSYLVNITRVAGVRRPTRSTLALEVNTPGRDLVPVGAQYRDAVRARFEF